MIEPLESRIAPALTVFSLHGVLTISGDPNVNVTVNELADHKIQVMDGASAFNPPLGGIKAIKILLKEGDDTVTLNYAFGYKGSTSISLGTGTNNVTFGADAAGSISITGSTGDDTVTVPAGRTIGGSLTVKAGDGLNKLDVSGTVSGNISYTGGVGTDLVTLLASGDVGKGLTAKLGDGDNQLELRGGVGTNVAFSSGIGNDTLLFLDGATVGGNLSAKPGNGTNGLSLGGDVTGALTVTGGAEVDTVTTSGTASAKSLTVALKAGGNLASIGGNFTGNVKVSGGIDNDFVSLTTGINIGGNATFSLSNGGNKFSGPSDFLRPLAQIGGKLAVSAGTGDDMARLIGLAIAGGVTVKLGGGENIFEIPRRGMVVEETGFTATSLLYVGGSGADTVSIASSLSTVSGAGTFNLGSGEDMMTYTGSSAVFQTKLTVNGGKGTDSFSPQSVVAGITTKFISIENLS